MVDIFVRDPRVFLLRRMLSPILNNLHTLPFQSDSVDHKISFLMVRRFIIIGSFLLKSLACLVTR